MSDIDLFADIPILSYVTPHVCCMKLFVLSFLFLLDPLENMTMHMKGLFDPNKCFTFFQLLISLYRYQGIVIYWIMLDALHDVIIYEQAILLAASLE